MWERNLDICVIKCLLDLFRYGAKHLKVVLALAERAQKKIDRTFVKGLDLNEWCRVLEDTRMLGQHLIYHAPGFVDILVVSQGCRDVTRADRKDYKSCLFSMWLLFWRFMNDNGA